jgi:NitT/TauT family transport system substrate-binding protein
MFHALKNMFGSITRAVLFAMLAALAAVGATAAHAAELIEVQIGMPGGSSLGYASYYVAQDAGFFERNGLRAKFVFLSAGAVPAALVTGGIHVTPLIGTAPRAALAGYKVRAVSLNLWKPTHSIVSRNSLKTMKDLKGKIIVAGPAKATPTILLRYLLEQHGLDPDKDVQILYVASPSARRTLIQSGQADALIDSITGGVELLRKMPNLHTLYAQSQMPNHSMDGVATSIELLEKNPDLVKRIIRSVAQADDFARKNPVEVGKVLLKYLNMPPETAAELVNGYVSSIADTLVPTDEMLEQDARFMSMAADKAITLAQLKSTWDTRLAVEVEKEMLKK